MKKILFVMICCLCLYGCGNENDIKNEELLVGEWTYTKEELGEIEYSTYVFDKKGNFYHSKCFFTNNDANCSSGEAEWSGTYSVNGNRLSLKIKNENQITKRLNFNIIDPPTSIIVDFNNMYLCDESKGLDCDDKYEKN